MVSARGVNGALEALAEFGRRPDASIGYAFPWAEGVRRA
jgi:hypothetical protein